MKKYEKVYRADYERWYQENQEYRNRVNQDRDRLTYHLMPETGWLNDPNGLCQHHGEYHIYYQYTPFEPTGELKLWGHYTTRDFIHYRKCDPVLFPDHDFDAHGVYSGSAFVEGDVIHYFYTGNVKYFDRDDYDYIMTGRGSNLVHCTSRDGFEFSEKELLMTNRDYPQDMSAHIRDPKIVKEKDSYYMVLGARDSESRGMALLYRSDDLEHWAYYNRITTRETFGYMWECPDLFRLDGQMCLISCPQGVKRRGVDFWNVHQCTVMKLDYDFERNTYHIEEDDIRMVDRGFDFYAPQTFEDESGRRILIGWMGIPDADYTNPTTEAGWQHALTIPRVLHMRNGRLIQEPVPEILQLREKMRTYCFGEGSADGREDADGKPGDSGKTEANGKPDLSAERELVYQADVKFSRCETVKLELRSGVTLSYEDGLLTLDLGTCGSGRTIRRAEVEELRNLQVFSDTSSLEIFVNGGEEVFTTRVYGHEGKMDISGRFGGEITVYNMKGFSYK